MTPQIGSSGADWSTALAPGLDDPGVNPVPQTGASEATGPPGLEHPGGSSKRTNAWNPDWNIWGSKAPGLEHLGGGGPGLECPGTKRPWIGTSGATEGGGYGDRGKRRGEHEREQGADEEGHEEQDWGSGRRRRRRRSGQTHGTRTGTSGEATHPARNIRGQGGPGLEPLGLHEEGQAAAARNGKEGMNKSQQRWRERTRRTRDGKREEKEKKERLTSTWNPDWNTRGRNALALEHPGGGGPGLEHPGWMRAWIGASGAAEAGGSGGAKKRQGEHEQEQGMVEREDTKDKSREEGGEGEEEKADKRKELGREHPGKQRTRNGTSRGRRPWTGTSREEASMDWSVRGCIRRRTRRRQETARRTSTRARKLEREDKKKTSRQEGGEGEEVEAASA